MRLSAAVAGYEAEIELRDSGASVNAKFDAKHYELDVRESGNGHVFVSEGKIFDCRIEGRRESGQPALASVGSQTHPIPLTAPNRRPDAAAARTHADTAPRR